MFTSPVKTNVMVAVAALLVTTGFASADPGKGSRWSDFASGPIKRSQPATARYAAVPLTSGVVVAPSATATATGQTIAIRGADGVVRVFPVQGGVVQQVPNQSTITVRDADGVIRTYPTVSGTSTNPAVVIPQRR